MQKTANGKRRSSLCPGKPCVLMPLIFTFRPEGTDANTEGKKNHNKTTNDRERERKKKITILCTEFT